MLKSLIFSLIYDKIFSFCAKVLIFWSVIKNVFLIIESPEKMKSNHPGYCITRGSITEKDLALFHNSHFTDFTRNLLLFKSLYVI